jgi:hypothetical protein
MRFRLLFACALGFGSTVACAGGSATAQGPRTATTPAVTKVAASQLPSACSTEGRTADARPSDVDGDGRPEVVKYYADVADPERPGERKLALIRQDIDLNWDGKLDVCRHFSAAGLVTKEEVDLDYDGRIDELRTFEDGQLVRAERDRNNDGRADIVRRFRGGKLVQKEIDSNDDGQPDRWEYFEGDRIDRIGFDLDHDGRVDRWAKASPAPAGT